MTYSLASNKNENTSESGEGDNRMVATAVLIIIAIAIIFVLVVVASNVTLFEDGSATLAGRNLGCIVRAWGCN